MTLSHAREPSCRNRRAVGYHGLSSRSSSQRQSGTKGSITQTGFTCQRKKACESRHFLAPLTGEHQQPDDGAIGEGGGVVGIYQRHDWAEEKRRARGCPGRASAREAGTP